MNRDNFFKDLEFYDIRGIKDPLYRRLRTFIDNPKFRPEVVKEGSVAASSLCMWVRAVYDYCLVVRTLEPKRKQLKSAEEELKKVCIRMYSKCSNKSYRRCVFACTVNGLVRATEGVYSHAQ